MECAVIWKAKFRSRHGGNDRKMKNHVNVDSRLLQTNKKYSQLKVSQKEKIAEWLFQETKEYYASNGIYPSREHLYEIVDAVYDKIEAAGIWIPYEEVIRHYRSKLSAIKKHIEKSQGDAYETGFSKIRIFCV